MRAFSNVFAFFCKSKKNIFQNTIDLISIQDSQSFVVKYNQAIRTRK